MLHIGPPTVECALVPQILRGLAKLADSIPLVNLRELSARFLRHVILGYLFIYPL